MPATEVVGCAGGARDEGSGAPSPEKKYPKIIILHFIMITIIFGAF